MTYHVRWLQSATDDLMQLWIDADSETRSDVNYAVRYLDYQLERDPHSIAESRDPGESVCFSEPVGVLVEIDDANGVVWVLSVWRYR